MQELKVLGTLVSNDGSCISAVGHGAHQAAREDWKPVKGVFVEFACPLHDAKSRETTIEKMLTLQHFVRAERPLPEPTLLRDLAWQPLCSARRRLELTGDSLLVVN